MPEQFDLLFFLPNLAPPSPTPFQSDGYVICSGKDEPWLKKLAPNAGNRASLKMLGKFRTASGERYRPACFLIRNTIPVHERSGDSIRAFRNLCALASITRYYAAILDNPHAAQWCVSWADQFQFAPFIAGQSGSVQTVGPVLGTVGGIPRQQPTGAFGNPTRFSLLIDRPLLERLFRAWRRCYLQQRDRRKLMRLFRSLDVAFHASLFPDDGLRSLSDVGSRLSLWVSAFEVLCNPGRNVSKRTVQKVLADAPYRSTTLKAQRYTVWDGWGAKRTKYPVSLPEALYDDLNWARNQFMHGNRVTRTTLHYRRSGNYAWLAHVAPVLYSAVLVSSLNRLKIAGAPLDDGKLTLRNLGKYMESRQGLDRVEDGLLAAGKRG